MMIRNGKFDFKLLHDISKIVTRNLNRVIDVNVYPLPEAKLSSMTHRPIGVGVQGLADAFMILELPFESAAARLLNAQIFETIYHGCLEMSVELAIREGPYASYKGSPMHRGQLQFDLWRVTPTTLWDWDDTRRRIAMFGIRNSLLVALMPTATTSQILGFTESFEPITRYRIIMFIRFKLTFLLATCTSDDPLQGSFRYSTHGSATSLSAWECGTTIQETPFLPAVALFRASTVSPTQLRLFSKQSGRSASLASSSLQPNVGHSYVNPRALPYTCGAPRTGS